MSMQIFDMVTISTNSSQISTIILQNVFEHAKDSHKHEIIDSK